MEKEAIRLINLKIKEKGIKITDLSTKIGMHPNSLANDCIRPNQARPFKTDTRITWFLTFNSMTDNWQSKMPYF